MAEAGLIEWRQTQGTLRVGGLGKGRVLVVGEGERPLPGTDATLRSLLSSGLPSGTLFAHLCRLAFIERWVGGPSTEVVSGQGGGLAALRLPLASWMARLLSLVHRCSVRFSMPASCCLEDRVHSPSVEAPACLYRLRTAISEPCSQLTART